MMAPARLKCYISPESLCSYLPDRSSRNLFVDPGKLDNGLYSQLIQYGFRRSGPHVYQPHCTSCTACIPLRVDVNNFAPRRRHRRCQKLNRDLVLGVNREGYRAEYAALCGRYLSERHPEGGMESMGSGELDAFLSSDWSDTVFLELRRESRLVALAVTDLVRNGISAVYTFFDPDEVRRSPGTYSILTQIRYARELGATWLYLGYWIDACSKMSYKRDFEPFQVFDGSTWRNYRSEPDSSTPANIPASARNGL